MVDQPIARGDIRRIVIKIGSRALLGREGHGLARFAAVAGELAGLRKRGHTVLLVSSGAVALGYPRLGLPLRPRLIADLQACAAVGQARLVHAYERAFAEHGLVVAQVLLTHAGLADRSRYLRARATIEALLERDAVPVINENDTVAIEELTFGDNDRLAALVAALVGADLLVLLTDVQGLLDEADTRVPVVTNLDAARRLVRASLDSAGLGGMGSKLDAAALCARRGVPTIIAPAAEPHAVGRILDGESLGTLVLPQGNTMASRKHWIAYTLKPRGSVTVDDGAARALESGKCSLLPAGVTKASGKFRLGDAIRIVGRDGRELARGLSRYDAGDVQRLIGARTQQIPELLGYYGGDEIVHRDDLVVL